jgi:hypothetical protein
LATESLFSLADGILIMLVAHGAELNDRSGQLKTTSGRRLAALRRAVLWTRHLGLTQHDVLLASYPKSGNTWLKFMLCHLLTGAEVDFDRSESICPGIGAHKTAPRLLPGGGRLIKSHEQFRSEYKKAIYIVRDGRDVAVSYYYHLLREGKADGAFSELLPLILDGKQDGYGTWRDHVDSWLDSPLNRAGLVCIARYEDCLSEPSATLARVVQFLGLDIEPSAIDQAIAANTADKMRAKEKDSQTAIKHKHSDIPFVRAATKGGWRSTFSEGDNALFEANAGATLDRLGYR